MNVRILLSVITFSALSQCAKEPNINRLINQPVSIYEQSLLSGKIYTMDSISDQRDDTKRHVGQWLLVSGTRFNKTAHIIFQGGNHHWQSVDKQCLIYNTQFAVSKKFIDKKVHELVLNTTGSPIDIYLNDSLVLSTSRENQFRVNINSLLQTNTNSLKVHFKDNFQDELRNAQKIESTSYNHRDELAKYLEKNQLIDKNESTVTILSLESWQPLEILAWSTARIEHDVKFIEKHKDENHTTFDVRIRIEVESVDKSGDIKIILADSLGNIYKSQIYQPVNKSSTITIQIELPNNVSIQKVYTLLVNRNNTNKLDQRINSVQVGH